LIIFYWFSSLSSTFIWSTTSFLCISW